MPVVAEVQVPTTEVMEAQAEREAVEQAERLAALQQRQERQTEGAVEAAVKMQPAPQEAQE